MMSGNDINIASVTEVHNSYYDLMPERQRNFEFLQLCPYKIYINLFYEPKKIPDEVIDLSIKTQEKKDEIFFEEEESELIKKETMPSSEQENKKEDRKENGIGTNLSIYEILVIILFLLGFCFVGYILVSFSDVLCPGANCILAVFRVFTWPLIMIIKLVKNICTSRNSDQIIEEDPEKLPDVVGL